MAKQFKHKKLVIVVAVAAVLAAVIAVSALVRVSRQPQDQAQEEATSKGADSPEELAWYNTKLQQIDDAYKKKDYALIQKMIDTERPIAAASGDQQYVFDVELQQVRLYVESADYQAALEKISELEQNVQQGSDNAFWLAEYKALVEEKVNA